MDIVWDDETTFKLIEIFETKSILWDSSSKHYKNNINKCEAWEDISAALGISMQDAKSKINRLRSQFAREKKKILSSITTGVGTAHSKKSKWKFYDALKFLSDETIKTSGSESDTMNETEDAAAHLLIQGWLLRPHTTPSVQYETNQDDVQETEQQDATMSAPQPQSTQQAPSSSQKTGKRKIDDNLNDLFITVKSAKEKMIEIRDEYDIYGQYVASELRAAKNENAVLQAKSYINNILIDMRMGKLHRLRISKSSRI
ncbi:unnamed protein product [Parnassius mnemosyne]|uniref:MADF domain-containing protein n=1 Tax=Parnassius mnemosyne TaxID=213953 RepID=A0AAV1KYM5_9NEOP